MRSLELNETDSPVILPCDNTTPVNTNNTIAGNYSYCYNEILLVNQSTSYYSLDFDYTFDKGTVCCYVQEVCQICYNFIVYCK